MKEAKIHAYENQDGLSCVTKNPENTRVHLVFVHGLGGGAFSTWSSGEQTELGFWPAAIAEAHSSVCVWTLHYTANILDWNPFAPSETIDIQHKSAWFLDQLVQNRIHEKPIVFVAHSLGGVLVKQALQFSQLYGDDRWRSVWKQTQAIVFLATPHVGSRLADIAAALANGMRARINPLARMFVRPSKALKNLEKHNPTLIYLRNWYRNHAPAQGVETIAYAEGKPLYGAVTVVDVEDANPQIANCPTIPLSDEDHISIAKPDNSARSVYRSVRRCLENLEMRLDDGRVEIEPSEKPEDEIMRDLAHKRDMVSLLSGYWWEIISIDNAIEISFFEIRPSLYYSVSCSGRHYDSNAKHISDWHSVIANVEKETGKIVLIYHWTGTRIRGDARGQRFQGFGRMGFELPGESGGRIDKGKGGFWDINESQPDQTVYKHVELRRAVDESVPRMVEGSHSEIKSIVLETISKIT